MVIRELLILIGVINSRNNNIFDTSLNLKKSTLNRTNLVFIPLEIAHFIAFEVEMVL